MKQPWEGGEHWDKVEEIKFTAGKRAQVEGVRSLVWGMCFGVLPSKLLSFSRAVVVQAFNTSTQAEADAVRSL